ncbi:MAG: FecR domain-containing protein [Elusimicrobia bacterium]|nr:FecR domain-containing protein [Elusimicrobiota bacterium]
MKRILAALMLTGFLTGLCRAETACVYEYKGPVLLLEPGSAVWQTLAKPAPLKEGSRVKTGAKGFCKILAGDGTLIDLDSNSETVVETLKLEKDGRNYVFNLIKGKIMWLIPKLKEKISRLEVKTPRAVCAVRGTSFTIVVSSDISNIGLFEGALDVTAAGKETSLNPGKEALVGADAEVKVSGRFSKFMQAEQRRYVKLQKYADTLRRKLAAREGYIDDFLNEQDKKLRAREKRIKDRLEKRDKK